MKKIVTELEEVREFYDAEEEHQQVSYTRTHPRQTLLPMRPLDSDSETGRAPAVADVDLDLILVRRRWLPARRAVSVIFRLSFSMLL